MKSTYNHHHVSREKVPSQGRATSNRTERRKEQRKAARAEKKQRIRERIAANHRLVRA